MLSPLPRCSRGAVALRHLLIIAALAWMLPASACNRSDEAENLHCSKLIERILVIQDQRLESNAAANEVFSGYEKGTVERSEMLRKKKLWQAWRRRCCSWPVSPLLTRPGAPAAGGALSRGRP